MPKLTKRFVETVEPSTKAIVLFDEQVTGFGLRIMPSGVRSYFVQYRSQDGRSRWFTIGTHGRVTAEEARKRARQILAEVTQGKDPAADRDTSRQMPTISDLLDRYLTEHVDKRNRPRTRNEVKRMVRLFIRHHLGRYKVEAVARSDLARLHHSLSSTPRQANHVLSVCSKVFGLAEIWGLRPDGSNPCRGIERYREEHRERFLSQDELERLGSTLHLAETKGLPWSVDEHKPTAKHLPKPENRRTLYPHVIRAAIELLLFTGCRLSEVLGLKWKQVDFAAGTIVLAETKAGRTQHVVMSDSARQVLKSLAEGAHSEWVLARRNDDSRPMSKETLEKAWQRIRAIAGVSDVRLHDLRHTFGTYAGQTGGNTYAIRDALRHKTVAMTARYVNRADDPIRLLSNQVGERIASSLAGRARDVVVPLRRGSLPPRAP